MTSDSFVDLNNKTILVTGGCGFIGSNFIKLVNKMYSNVTIVNLDKMGTGSSILYMKPELKFENIYKWYPIDIVYMETDPLFTEEVDVYEYDYIFHFAAESHVDRSITTPSCFIQNNVMGVVSLLDWVRDQQPQAKLINISTDEVYGHLNLNDDPFTEKSTLHPRSPYSASKASADLIASSYVSTYELDIITTRCCNNLGPRQHVEKLIPKVIHNIIHNEPIPVYGDGLNVREWIYVNDHNRSILEIAKMGVSGQVYNIGSGVEKTNLEIISRISNILEIEPKIKFVEDRKGHDFRYAIASYNYDRQFGLMSFEDALETTIRHYQYKFDTLG